jgi:hypothetical protein
MSFLQFNLGKRQDQMPGRSSKKWPARAEMLQLLILKNCDGCKVENVTIKKALVDSWLTGLFDRWVVSLP